MLKLIGKIRRQPKQRRDNIAFGIASGFTFLIGALWLFNAPNTFNGVLGTSEAVKSNESGFFETISSQAAAVRESISADSPETESLKALMDEYRASSTQASSTQSVPSAASSTSSTTTTTATPVAPKETFERFGTETSYESKKPREVRIQAVPKATTSTTTSE